MSIKKYYEFVCEYCGYANFPPADSIKDGIKLLRERDGAVFTKDGKNYCRKLCFLDAKDQKLK